MPQSAGILMHCHRQGKLRVLLVHPGGPFFRNKDEGNWTIPKGQVNPGEDVLEAAKREFAEETGLAAPGPFTAMKPVKMKSGKVIHAWAMPGEIDAAAIKSNTFSMEWPPRSGKQAEFPEIDRAEFFDLETARRKIHPAQQPLLDELAEMLG